MTTTLNKKSTKRTYGGLSEDQRIQERRERFLAAGLEIFGTLGLRGATVRALCREAGLTERYFYESFADTESLFCDVYARVMSDIELFFARELPQLPEDIDERVTAALGLFYTKIMDARIVRVLYLESAAGSEKVVAMHRSRTRQYMDVVAHWIRIDNPQLNLSHEEMVCVAVAINGACTTLAVEWMLSGYALAQEAMVASSALVILGIMRELRSRGRPS